MPVTITDPHWRRRAACLGQTDVFFPHEDGSPPHQRRTMYAAARALCDRCGVLDDCLADDLTTEGLSIGFRAGMTAKERSMLTGRRRGTIT